MLNNFHGWDSHWTLILLGPYLHWTKIRSLLSVRLVFTYVSSNVRFIDLVFLMVRANTSYNLLLLSKCQKYCSTRNVLLLIVCYRVNYLDSKTLGVNIDGMSLQERHQLFILSVFETLYLGNTVYEIILNNKCIDHITREDAWSKSEIQEKTGSSYSVYPLTKEDLFE
ncbi:hypothetical protein PHYBLDRAFT_71781 [Phycomyces blakesleeanus NRRL 1555(-)]|uniref:Uncharacterized protein n=1 Tax=Phycomyces blakesleeanus (strain ATCC 8743b / DSM 1359 / FGSC 10004 / NBRC 33097 / NRRL 1555) TaxID=763407 RepID=A0A163EE89_PHYB8|nr:hypothetical protein PHYBLDRAFT_71781 [Phycomyces blakesleeanus NRRL 1555(-)]OAD78170.1 hypothetical protein PHYBLDRAFT_71781 [Phycomyces blakesleeanus NRRL 1555(-)]|eukprot:XP_018296210.1 hypothetical protein PHYBLDRAFT_71781 [Phycomyces blakesleeanus NRRL 1555(-)]